MCKIEEGGYVLLITMAHKHILQKKRTMFGVPTNEIQYFGWQILCCHTTSFSYRQDYIPHSHQGGVTLGKMTQKPASMAFPQSHNQQ